MTISAEDKELYISIWAKAVDTQMHFNEMSVKARQFGLAFVAAALGLGVVMFSRGQEAYLEIPFLVDLDCMPLCLLRWLAHYRFMR